MTSLATSPLVCTPAPAAGVFRRLYQRRSRPVVLKGLLDGWPARGRWSPEGLGERFGEAAVTVTRTRGGALATGAREGLSQERMRLGDFMGALVSGAADPGYLMAPIEEWPAALRAEVKVPFYCSEARLLRSKLWVSAAGAVSPLHRDAPHNLLAQVAGRKRVTLVDPAEGRRVYPRSLLSSLPNFSQVDVEEPDFNRFPRLDGVPAFQCEIGPGDTLFIPSGWWHHVRTLEASISVNFWWAEGRGLLLAAAAEAFKRLRRISR